MLGSSVGEKGNDKKLYRRLQGFLLIIVVLFLALGTRLFVLQIVQTEKYAMLSNKNQVRIISQPARRGNIYDRNNIEMANSKIVFAIAISSGEIAKEDQEYLATNLAQILNDPKITKESIMEQIKNHFRKYEPIIVTRFPYDGNMELVSIIEENRDKLPGVYIIEEPQRNYPLGIVAGHTLGQMGVISDSETDLIEQYNYLSTDWIGKSGLEKSMERFVNKDGLEIGLRGKRGLRTVEVDSRHRTVRVLSEEPALPGNSLVLTIDAKVQKAMEDSLVKTIAEVAKGRPKSKAGAAVLIDVKTGGIIAMASHPTMNPNDFIQGLSQEQVKYYWNDSLKPLFNRTISAAYPPGSTFKPSTAMAVEAGGVIPGNFTVTCNSSIWKKPRAKCPSAHGRVDMTRAMAVSCNAFFQETAYRTGIEKLNKTFKQLGYGQLTGIELPGEVKGTLGNPEWKEKNFPEGENTWRSYDTFYMAMGQGYSNYTPIQMANAIATIANGGTRMQNYLVGQINDWEGNQVYKMEPSVIDTIDIEPANAELVRKAMRAVCQPRGTAYSLFGNYPVAVAAKTGTAQTGLDGDNPNADYHGWFVAFAPYDDPQVAFAGMIEYGYHGSTSAGKVCKAVFDEYFGYSTNPVVFTSDGNAAPIE